MKPDDVVKAITLSRELLICIESTVKDCENMSIPLDAVIFVLSMCIAKGIKEDKIREYVDRIPKMVTDTLDNIAHLGELLK